MTYQNGSESRITGRFTDASGNLLDPVTITCTVEQPNKTQTIYTYPDDLVHAVLTRNSVGNYSKDVSLLKSGIWRYRFYATGAGTLKVAGEGSLVVRNTGL